MSYRLSLIIPCYNEEKNLPILFDRCRDLPADIEVVFVNNGSNDGSAKVFEHELSHHSNWRLVHVTENKGYGFGILSGLREAQAAILGWTHADLQTNPLDCLEALKIFTAHPQTGFIKGSRYGRPFFDRIFTWGMSIFETLILGKVLWDINAQPTLFRRNFFSQWKNPPYDFSLDLYAYYMAIHHHLTIRRFPVLFAPRVHGTSHWNINWREKWKFIRRTMGFSFHLRTLKRRKQLQ